MDYQVVQKGDLVASSKPHEQEQSSHSQPLLEDSRVLSVLADLDYLHGRRLPLPELAQYAPLEANNVLLEAYNAPPGNFPGQLVLTFVVGYSLRKVSKFYQSFSRHVPDAHLVFFALNLPPDLDQWQLEGASFQLFRSGSDLEHPLFSHIHFVTYRWLVVEAFLRNLYSTPDFRDRLVLLCDARDVLFLGDIFQGYQHTPGVHLFAETTSLTIREEVADRKWMEACYGADVAGRLLGFPVINAGFIIGRQRHVTGVLAAFRKEMARNRECARSMPVGPDQVMLMFNVYNGYLAAEGVPFQLSFNPTGRVLHGSNCRGEYVVKNGSFYNVKGEQLLAIHMFDRLEEHGDVVEKIVKDLEI